MCNSSADAIDAEIMDELKQGKKVEPNGKYDGIVQAIVEKAKEIRLGTDHKETLVVKDVPIRLYIRGEWLVFQIRKRREFENHRLSGRYGTWPQLRRNRDHPVYRPLEGCRSGLEVPRVGKGRG